MKRRYFGKLCWRENSNFPSSLQLSLPAVFKTERQGFGRVRKLVKCLFYEQPAYEFTSTPIIWETLFYDPPLHPQYRSGFGYMLLSHFVYEWQLFEKECQKICVLLMSKTGQFSAFSAFWKMLDIERRFIIQTT